MEQEELFFIVRIGLFIVVSGVAATLVAGALRVLPLAKPIALDIRGPEIEDKGDDQDLPKAA